MLENNARLEKAQRERQDRPRRRLRELISAAAQGDFSRHRMVEGGRNGFFLTLAQDLNTLLATTEEGYRKSRKFFGPLPRAISPNR